MNVKESQKKALLDLVAAIYDCLEKQQIMPCLVLMYSGIEIVARMASKPKEGTRSYFVRWVNQYVLAKGQFQVRGIDLYAARCGMVHAFSADSDLYKRGKARLISYSWGSADVRKLNASIAALQYEMAALHLNDFVQALMTGIADFMDDLTRDPEAEKRADAVRTEWFTTLPSAFLDQFLSDKDTEESTKSITDSVAESR